MSQAFTRLLQKDAKDLCVTDSSDTGGGYTQHRAGYGGGAAAAPFCWQTSGRDERGSVSSTIQPAARTDGKRAAPGFEAASPAAPADSVLSLPASASNPRPFGAFGKARRDNSGEPALAWAMRASLEVIRPDFAPPEEPNPSKRCGAERRFQSRQHLGKRPSQNVRRGTKEFHCVRWGSRANEGGAAAAPLPRTLPNYQTDIGASSNLSLPQTGPLHLVRSYNCGR